MNKIESVILNALSDQFNHRLRIEEKRPDIYQLFLPVYHEDGDMVEVYLDARDCFGELNDDSRIRISDFGMSLMRLSYSYEIDTPNKEKILNRILEENRLREEDGHIICDTSPGRIYPAIMQFCQTVAKISSMRQFKREVVESLFYEMLDEFIMASLRQYHPEHSVVPLEQRDDLEVDYRLKVNGHDVYLFAVKDSSKARLATISCLEFLRNELPFKSFIVHEDFDKLSAKDRKRLTSACDKQFPSLEDFRTNSELFLKREAFVR